MNSMKKQLYVVLIVLLSGMNVAAAISLSDALVEVARKHGATISYSPSLIAGIEVAAVPVCHTVEADLRDLLTGTDFTYSKAAENCFFLQIDKHKVALRKKREAEEAERLARARIEAHCRREEARKCAIPGKLLMPDKSPLPQYAVEVDIVLPIVEDDLHNERQKRFQLKTNLLLLATSSANLAFEVAVSRHFSIELPVSANFWTVSGARLHHMALFPTLKYWLACEPFGSDYIGAYLGFANYDIGNISLLGKNFEEYYYDGKLFSAGIVYGHRFQLSTNFALEAEIGMGYVFTHYHRTPVTGDYILVVGNKNKFSLTRLSLNMCYTF